MKKNNVVIFCLVLLLLAFNGRNAIGDRQKLDQLLKVLKNQKLSNSDRENAYIALLDLREFKIVSTLLADSSISMHEWPDWAYDYQTRFEQGTGNEKNFESFLYKKIETNDSFAKKFAFVWSSGQYDESGCFKLLSDNSPAMRKIGYVILQNRYPNVPAFDYQARDEVRTKQLQDIDTFLKAKK